MPRKAAILVHQDRGSTDLPGRCAQTLVTRSSLAVTLSQPLLAQWAEPESQESLWVLTPASGRPWKARGDVSPVYLVAPLQGLFGAWMVPPPPLWVSLHAPCRVLGDTEMALLCIFAPQHFIDFL